MMMNPVDYGSPVEDLDDKGRPVLWLPGENPGDSMPKLVHRRAKRIIPDDEKDDKYWEKRKRNNMAAKRSRENKRQLEIDIRNKVNYLEEENALLQKEVTLMKSRFGIPQDQSVLSPEERQQCLQEVKNAQAAAAEGRALKMNGTDDEISSTSPGIYTVPIVPGMGRHDDHDLSRALPDPHGGHSPANGGHVNSQHKNPVKEEPPLHDVTESSVFVPNGPSLYGPFNPPMVWGPNAGQHHPDYSALHFSHQQQQQQQHQQHKQQQHHQHHQQQQQQHHQNAYGGHPGTNPTKLPSINNAFHDKGPAMAGMYGGRYAMGPATVNPVATTAGSALPGHQYPGDGRTNYDFYMAAAYSQGQAVYSPANNSPNMIAAPADLSLAARGSKQQDDAASHFLEKSSLPDEAQIPQSMDNGMTRSHAMSQQQQQQHQHQQQQQHRQHRGLDSLMNAVSMANMVQSQRDSLYRASATHDDLLAAAPDPGVLDKREGSKEDKELSSELIQENDELKHHIHSLQAQIETMQKLQQPMK